MLNYPFKYFPTFNGLPFYPDNKPLYFGNEQTGYLKRVIIDFFNHQDLDEKQFEILKEYMLHWVMYPGFRIDGDIILELKRTVTQDGLYEINEKLLEINIDIF